MCHEYTSRVWERELAERKADDDGDEEERTPEFLNDEGGDDVELLTDGGA